MTKTSRALGASAALLLALALAACAPSGGGATDEPVASASASADASGSDGECAGVEVVVELPADLDVSDSPAGTTCVEADEPILASDAVAEAGLTTEGTDEYGDQVVCRVNGVPAEDFALPAEDGSDYFETCASMPAAFAYWSLWTKAAGGEWGYAEEGLSTLEVSPGESIALLFTVNGEPAAPSV
ncbi:hypothetical protein SAMN05428970_0594 [Agromyces sp. CF514]|uniref:hypothetical protein n=1 Tax=Agromyces sp. CF514 TaxID=1881031 RepID=UPI0008EB5992|nr:hypothetical protein [Agromyces sp. CF514]SFR69066.1 hypothetical protein SAMN05428970_0594 [Agromyces sp. CF514]